MSNDIHVLYTRAIPNQNVQQATLPEESAAQVDVHVDATYQGTQQLLLSSPALEIQTPGKLISRRCTTFWNISGMLCIEEPKRMQSY